MSLDRSSGAASLTWRAGATATPTIATRPWRWSSPAICVPPSRPSTPAARAGAQAVRPSLPTELYEQVNALHWRAQEASWQRDLYRYLMDVQMSVRLVDGLLEDTMFHAEARDFVRLGKFVERTGNVTAVVTHKAADLAGAPGGAVEGAAGLKAWFAVGS